MSSSGSYTTTTDPDGNVLWYWYEKYHCESKRDRDPSKKSTKKLARASIKLFERFLAVQAENEDEEDGEEYDRHWSNIDYEDIETPTTPRPRNVTPELTEQFLLELRKNYSPDGQQSTYGCLSQAYDWLERNIKPVEENVFVTVKKKFDDTNTQLLETPEERNAYIIPISEAREIVRSWDHPLWLAIQMLIAKFPRRRGAVSNLDYYDVYLNHPGCTWDTHREFRHRNHDHLLFRPDKRADDPGRNTGNKTSERVVVPIDEELRNVLLWYLTIRPEPDDPHSPLFVSQKTDKRLSGSSITSKFTRRAKRLGHYYEPHDDDNVGVHYWRHWGTSWYEDRFGGDDESKDYTTMTTYLRGDSDKGTTKGIYNNYTRSKRDMILEAMPMFLEPYVENND